MQQKKSIAIIFDFDYKLIKSKIIILLNIIDNILYNPIDSINDILINNFFGNNINYICFIDFCNFLKQKNISLYIITNNLIYEIEKLFKILKLFDYITKIYNFKIDYIKNKIISVNNILNEYNNIIYIDDDDYYAKLSYTKYDIFSNGSNIKIWKNNNALSCDFINIIKNHIIDLLEPPLNRFNC